MRSLTKAVPQRKEKNRQWKPQSQCAFLRLPAEIRNEIYTLALTFTDLYIELRNLGKPHLTATCRQIEHEALPMFFANNRFHFTIRVNPDWRLYPIVHRQTAKWIKEAGDLAGPIHEVHYFLARPERDVKPVLDIVSRENRHFGTNYSLIDRPTDESIFPHCKCPFLADTWTSLARRSPKKLSVQDLIWLTDDVIWMKCNPLARFANRRIGKERLQRFAGKVGDVIEFVWPSPWIPDWDFEPRDCECRSCRDERKHEKKLAEKAKRFRDAERKVEKKLAKKKGITLKTWWRPWET